MEAISRKEKYNVNKLHKRLRRLVGSAITDFNMIEAVLLFPINRR